MKLYYTPGACAMAPHIVFEWTGLPYELALADRADPAFKAINPMGAVPALVTDDLGTLTQCGAIMRYQTRLAGGEYGPKAGDPREAYEFDHWECFFTGDVHPAFIPFFMPFRFTKDPAETALDQVRAAAPDLVARSFAVLDAHLAGRRTIIGERLTFIDAYATPMIRWAKTGLPETYAKFPNIQRHYQMMAADPGVARAMARQGIEA